MSGEFDAGCETAEATRRFRLIFDSAYQFMGLVGIDGRVLDCNQASLARLGLTRDRVIGKLAWETPWPLAVSPADQERFRRTFAAAVGGEFIRHQVELETPQGERVVLDYSLSPVRSDGGEVTCLVAEGRDVTSQARTEEALREANRLLLEALDEIKTLRGLIPMCAYCKRIRDGAGDWQELEVFLRANTEAQVSHGICPQCLDVHAEHAPASRH